MEMNDLGVEMSPGMLCINCLKVPVGVKVLLKKAIERAKAKSIRF